MWVARGETCQQVAEVSQRRQQCEVHVSLPTPPQKPLRTSSFLSVTQHTSPPSIYLFGGPTPPALKALSLLFLPDQIQISALPESIPWAAQCTVTSFFPALRSDYDLCQSCWHLGSNNNSHINIWHLCIISPFTKCFYINYFLWLSIIPIGETCKGKYEKRQTFRNFPKVT